MPLRSGPQRYASHPGVKRSNFTESFSDNPTARCSAFSASQAREPLGNRRSWTVSPPLAGKRGSPWPRGWQPHGRAERSSAARPHFPHSLLPTIQMLGPPQKVQKSATADRSAGLAAVLRRSLSRQKTGSRPDPARGSSGPLHWNLGGPNPTCQRRGFCSPAAASRRAHPNPTRQRGVLATMAAAAASQPAHGSPTRQRGSPARGVLATVAAARINTVAHQVASARSPARGSATVTPTHETLLARRKSNAFKVLVTMPAKRPVTVTSGYESYWHAVSPMPITA
jgi:hypothetical protein